jgi:hypothetical protein
MELLEKKKNQNRNNKIALSSTFETVERPKSKESLWKEENVESSKI